MLKNILYLIILLLVNAEAKVSLAILPPANNNIDIENKYIDVESIHLFIIHHLIDQYDVTIRDRENLSNAVLFGKFNAQQEFSAAPVDYSLLSMFDGTSNSYKIHLFNLKKSGTYKKLKMIEVPFAPKTYINPDSIGKSAADKIARALALSKKKTPESSEVIEKAKLKVSLETLTARQAALINQAPSDLSGYLAEKDIKALDSGQLTLEITDFESLSASLKESAIQSIQGDEDVKWSNPVDLHLSILPIANNTQIEDYLIIASSPKTATVLSIAKRSELINLRNGLKNFLLKSHEYSSLEKIHTRHESANLMRSEALLYLEQAKYSNGNFMDGFSQKCFRLSLYQAALGLTPYASSEWKNILNEGSKALKYRPRPDEIAYLHRPDSEKKGNNPPEAKGFRKLYDMHFSLPLQYFAENEKDSDLYISYLLGLETIEQPELAISEFRKASKRLQHRWRNYPINPYIGNKNYDAAIDLYYKLNIHVTASTKAIVAALLLRNREKEAYMCFKKDATYYLNNIKTRELVWFLNCAEKYDGIDHMLEMWADSRALDKPIIIECVCRSLEKNNEMKKLNVLISCSLIRLENKKSDFYDHPEVIKYVEATAEKYNFKPLSLDWKPSKTKLLSDYKIEIMLEKGVQILGPFKYAFQELADFWGAEVHVYHNAFSTSEFPYYNSVREILYEKETVPLFYHLAPADDQVLERTFITSKNLARQTTGRTPGASPPYITRYRFSISSTYQLDRYCRNYIKFYTTSCSKKFVRNSTISSAVYRKRKELKGADNILPCCPKPCILGFVSKYTYSDHRLVFDPSTRAIYESLTPADIKEAVKKQNSRIQSRIMPLSKKDQQWVDQTKRNIKNAKKTIFHPSPQPSKN